jgi:hypothetical protein|tara:strand:+ start:671 stop:808 length:138 start_codon:yes stop_codon:yes gene_type:complete
MRIPRKIKKKYKRIMYRLYKKRGKDVRIGVMKLYGKGYIFSNRDN